MRKRKIYMEVTTDDYELPVRVCGSARELADFCGVGVDCIYSSVSMRKHGSRKSKYVLVEVEEMIDTDRFYDWLKNRKQESLKMAKAYANGKHYRDAELAQEEADTFGYIMDCIDSPDAYGIDWLNVDDGK